MSVLRTLCRPNHKSAFIYIRTLEKDHPHGCRDQSTCVIALARARISPNGFDHVAANAVCKLFFIVNGVCPSPCACVDRVH